MARVRTFRRTEVVVALVVALTIEFGIYLAFAATVELRSLKTNRPQPPEEVPVAVLPVLDELPLLKQGSKKKAQLPDIWRKPIKKTRYEDKSAPSVHAKKKLKELPTNEVAVGDEKAAPEDAELAKKVDNQVEDDENAKDPKFAEEGAADGEKEGTEVDPLKAFVLDQYRKKLVAWFKRGFVFPQVPCDVVVRVSATILPDRSVGGFTVVALSRNNVFDTRVRSHMQKKVGQTVPPPPPNYREFLGERLPLRFKPESSQCQKSSKKRSKPTRGPAESPAPKSPAKDTVPEQKPAIKWDPRVPIDAPKKPEVLPPASEPTPEPVQPGAPAPGPPPGPKPE